MIAYSFFTTDVEMNRTANSMNKSLRAIDPPP
jgi:hypothetical protein